jgi:hypothetical protein
VAAHKQVEMKIGKNTTTGYRGELHHKSYTRENESITVAKEWKYN